MRSIVYSTMGRGERMGRRFSWVFLMVSLAFFLFIVGLTGYRIEDARKHNAALARERMSDLGAKALSLRDITGGFDAPQFKKDMRDVYDAEPRLLLLSLRSPEDGILYLVARNRSYMREPREITPGWHGTPVYQVSSGYEMLLSRAIGDAQVTVTMDALFVILGREDLYPVVRDDLYLFLAFLLVCGVVILIVMSIQEDPVELRARPSVTGVSPFSSPPQSAVPNAAPEERIVAVPPEPQLDTGRALTSPRTGLAWADYLEPRLRAELERAAGADQDVALARIRIDEPFADARLPIVSAAIARMLKESFPLHDLIFETGNDSYTLLLPDIEVDAAVRLLDEFRVKVAAAPVEGRPRTVSIGVSSRGGRLIDDMTLLEEADVSSEKAAREGGNQVIGFRADPSRYRDALSSART
jgi:GGDEF domain-containing protein